MKNNSICVVQIDGFWIEIPAFITYVRNDKTCAYHIKGHFDYEITEEHIYKKWADYIDALALLREPEELPGQMAYDDFLLDDRE